MFFDVLVDIFSYDLILGVLGFGAIFILLIGRAREKYAEKSVSAGFSLIFLAIALLATLFAPSAETSLVYFNDFVRYLGLVIFTSSFLISLASIGYAEIEYYPEYFSLLLASTLGMFLIPMAKNLILLYAGWELMSIPAYVLVALKKEREKAIEATFKYFIFGAISSGLILYGISIFYGATGTLIIQELSKGLMTDGWDIIDYIGLITITTGFGIKVGIVPFHMWIPDTYQGGPLTTSTFLTTSSKNAGFGAIMKVLLVGLSLQTTLLYYRTRVLLAALALITMIGGNLLALAQKNIIRMLAYSSIAHAGYVLVGVTVATSSSTRRGVTASLFHLFTYSISDIAAFICAAFFLGAFGLKTIDDYEGIGKRAQFPSFTMGIALLSLAGIPGLAGFASKFTLFFVGIEGGMLWLSIALALNSAFSLGYYGRLVKRMFLHEGSQKPSSALPKSFIALFLITLVLIVLMGVRPFFFVDLAEKGTTSLFP